ncbi:N-6 DNA methylase [Streptomyces sp. NPDC096354]|uniref:N-6 DNA methylase n=1 Tax=Streptomyces sp. NPDC096354 TaxID=3366088 RepID=UPI0037F7E4AA
MAGDGNRALADFIWSMTDLLRGGFKANQYGRVILPFTVLRRMDCLRQYKADRWQSATTGEGAGTAAVGSTGGSGAWERSDPATEGTSQTATGPNWNGAADGPGGSSGPGDPGVADGLGGLLRGTDDEAPRDAERLLAKEVQRFVQGFPADVVDVLDSLGFADTVRHLADVRLLRHVVSRFAALDLSSAAVSDQRMGQEYEELLRRFTEASLEISGEHTTPRDVNSLTAGLLLGPDSAVLARARAPIRVHDPCCGIGGMFSAVDDVLRSMGSPSKFLVFGQEINRETYATARSARMMKGEDPGGIVHGDVLENDRHHGETFDYLLANPPIGLMWKRQQDEVKREARELGFSGRFGAGLPRVTDSSLLFVQHMVAHMRPADEGGARAAVLFSASPLHRGGAGSGESEIRRWLLEQDLLEGVVALPGNLWPHTSIPMYVWLLSNRKTPHLRGKVIALDARRRSATLRKPLGSKRHYLADQHIAEVLQRYEAAHSGALEENQAADGENTALLLDVADLGYREVTVDHPLRQHFTMSATALATVESSKPLTRFDEADTLLRALRSLAGKTWPAWAAFESACFTALKDAGLPVELTRPLWRLIRKAVAVPDPAGEIQKDEQRRTLPDPALRVQERVPLHQDVREFMRREIEPDYPDAWTDLGTVRIGYALPQAPFLTNQPGKGFGPLSKVARQMPSRSLTRRAKEGVPLLRGRDLQTAGTTADLPDAAESEQALAPCTGGDVVGQFGNWRLMPPEFGDALTPLTVLRPIGNSGRALCEWLRTRASEEGAVIPRVSMNSLVPVALIKDADFDSLLGDLDVGRTALATTTSRILPNVFRDPQANVDETHQTARAAASEARIIGELIQPLGDPVWRAEWSYPYHVAALARQYRIAATLAERKDALLKLGESVARCVGVLALAVLIRRQRQSFTRKLREPFARGGGATFGTWNHLIRTLVEAGPVPELPELEGTLDPGGALGPLARLLDIRNDSGHAYGVRAAHELEREVNALEPVVVAALESVGWLSGLHWDLVDACAYTANGFTLVGRRLRGSHPDWEPFERPRPDPLVPNRIYVEGPSSPEPLELWPIATGEVCQVCGTRELFLLNKVEKNQVMTLRSGRDHEIRREIS